MMASLRSTTVKVVASIAAAALVAVGSTVATVTVLSWRANATEKAVEHHEGRLGIVERNQVKLNLYQRELRRSSEWTQDKLDLLLHASGLRVPSRPALPPSDLEAPGS